MKIKKAVIPVAGKGTRFLPATKNIPKEMIPIIDRPMIHYAVEEAVKSGIEEVILVTSSGKESIENYFDRNMELEGFLENAGKDDLLAEIRNVGSMINVMTVRQKEQLGLGHAVLCAKPLVGDEPFAVILGDDLILGENPVTKQLIEFAKVSSADAVIGVMDVPREDTKKYGIVDGEKTDNSKLLIMNKMVEKPNPDQAPTTLATPGRYLFKPEIFDYLERIPRGVGGEYQLTDAINLMCQEMKVVSGQFEGERHDTGNVPSYLQATVDFAMNSSKWRSEMEEIIRRSYERYIK